MQHSQLLSGVRAGADMLDGQDLLVLIEERVGRPAVTCAAEHGRVVFSHRQRERNSLGREADRFEVRVLRVAVLVDPAIVGCGRSFPCLGGPGCRRRLGCADTG